jgi:hypothetical protein
MLSAIFVDRAGATEWRVSGRCGAAEAEVQW